MAILLLMLLLVLNFIISWSNASYVGRYWSESKEIGGSFRVYIVVGYIMAIAGFTMVYGYILLLIYPFILQIAGVEQELILQFEQLASDLIYLFRVFTIIPTGFYIWLKSLKNFWERKTLSSGLIAGYNSYAQIHNVVSAARNAPSAFGRVIKALFGGKSKKKSKTYIVLCAILIFIIAFFAGYFTASAKEYDMFAIIAIFGGYFTASAIMEKSDKEYDMFADLQRRYPEKV